MGMDEEHWAGDAGEPERAAGGEPPSNGSPPEGRPAEGRRVAFGLGAAAAVGLAGAVGAVAADQAGLFGPHITVNGHHHRVVADPNTPLLYVLRNELGLRGLRFGCGFAECGACTVQLEGTAIRSCVTRVGQVAGRSIITLEGLGAEDNPSPLQKAFIDHQAAQCGYCIPGMIVEADAFLKRTPKPSLAQIKTALAGHLCRCGSHYRILRAVQQAAGTLHASAAPRYEESQFS
jgi:nicotinate dehydrogenase subunit A